MRSSRLLLLLLSSQLLAVVRADIFYYHKLKKIMTALAFARALGRRPTILPVPIPIPIPISQNEVVRVPSASAKTILNLAGSPKYSGRRGKYTGSSSYGYSLPGSFETSIGGSSFGGSKVLVMDGNNVYDAIGGSDFASPSNVIRLVSGKQRGFRDKPKRYIVMDGGFKTMRNSDSIRWIEPPTKQQRSKKTSSVKRKPIPVGEKFRLPP